MTKDEVTKVEEELYHETDKINLQSRSPKPRIESQEKTDFYKSISFAKSGGNVHNFEQKTFEKAKTISFVRGKGNLNHNNRVFSARNVDTERTKNNVIIVQEKIADAYKKNFGEAVEAYNSTQKRKCRQKTVKSYMDEIKKNEKNYQRTKLFYEQVIQFGTMNDTGNLTNPEEAEKAKQALLEYVQEFQTRNKNLYVFNAVLHMDEATPHVHLDYIPVAREGAKRGLKVRNAFTQALKEQGIIPDKDQGENEFTAWRKREIEELKQIAVKHNIKVWEKHTEKRKNLNIDEYRELGRQATEQAKKEVQAELSELQNKNIELQKANEILQEKLQQQQSTVAHQNENTTAKNEKSGEIEKKQQHNSPTDERKNTGTMSDTPEKQTKQQEQQQPVTVPEEKTQPEQSKPYQPYVSKYRPNEWAFRMIESEIKTKEEMLQKKQQRLDKLEKDAIAAAKSSWNVFKSLKELKQDYLKKHKAPELKKEIIKLDVELQALKKQLEQAETKAMGQPEQKPQPEQKKVKNKLVVKHKEKDNARTRGGLSR